MTKRFTSGGVGRFTFETANRLLDAADRIEGTPLGDRGSAIIDPRSSIVARITSQLPSSLFSPDTPREFPVWEWNEVSVNDDPQNQVRRKIVMQGGSSSALYNQQTKGYAVCVGGQAQVNDIVVLHPLRNIATSTQYGVRSGERWFAFTAPGQVERSVMLWIVSPPAALGGTYSVRPEVRIGTQYNPHPFMPPGPAINLYEVGRHGQAIQFTNPNSRLDQDGFVSGHVLGRPINQEGQPLLYAFDMAYPVRPACNTGGGSL